MDESWFPSDDDYLYCGHDFHDSIPRNTLQFGLGLGYTAWRQHQNGPRIQAVHAGV